MRSSLLSVLLPGGTEHRMAEPRNTPHPPKVKAPSCHKCGASLATGPKLVVKGYWTCPKCVYEDEYPEATEESRGPVKSKRARPLQRETLFDVAPKRRDG